MIADQRLGDNIIEPEGQSQFRNQGDTQILANHGKGSHISLDTEFNLRVQFFRVHYLPDILVASLVRDNKWVFYQIGRIHLFTAGQRMLNGENREDRILIQRDKVIIFGHRHGHETDIDFTVRQPFLQIIMISFKNLQPDTGMKGRKTGDNGRDPLDGGAVESPHPQGTDFNPPDFT